MLPLCFKQLVSFNLIALKNQYFSLLKCIDYQECILRNDINIVSYAVYGLMQVKMPTGIKNENNVLTMHM